MNERRRIIEGAGSVVYPVKGDLIKMTLGNATPFSGTQDLYRVLKINNSIAEVVAMYRINRGMLFNSRPDEPNYSGSLLDNYLNSTWYNTLSDTVKNAIINKTIIQYHYSGSKSYPTSTHQSQANYSTKKVNQSGLVRHIYALDVEDIEEYFNHYFTTNDLYNTFGGSDISWWWLRSHAGSSYVYCMGSYIFFTYPNGNVSADNYCAKPAFQIDLSKISWEFNA